MNGGPHARYGGMGGPSCDSTVQWGGTADRITNPTVMALRCILDITQLRPRGPRSNTSAPPWIRGRWNVNTPRSIPITVFGRVHTNPSAVATWRTLSQGVPVPGVS